jgi:hypothetical protein
MSAQHPAGKALTVWVPGQLSLVSWESRRIRRREREMLMCWESRVMKRQVVWTVWTKRVRTMRLVFECCLLRDRIFLGRLDSLCIGGSCQLVL